MKTRRAPDRDALRAAAPGPLRGGAEASPGAAGAELGPEALGWDDPLPSAKPTPPSEDAQLAALRESARRRRAKRDARSVFAELTTKLCGETFARQEETAFPGPPAAEAALLGAVLFDGAGTLPALDRAGFTGAMLADPAHRTVWEAIHALSARGAAVDHVTVEDELRARGTFDRIGGRGGLNALLEKCETPAHVASYAAQVREAYNRRTLDLELRRVLEELPRGNVKALRGRLRALAEDGRTETAVELFSAVALAAQPIDATETLLGTGSCRYLERGAVLMLAAPSGVGKSHIAAQAAVSWSCGRPAFGLPITGAPLRVLTVQAENPPNDARAIAANMLRGLALSPAERALVDANTRQAWLPGTTGTAFLARLAGMLRDWPADLVFIDPLAGFADGDLVRPEVVQAFCRAGLGRVAVESRCALFVLHHVPKPKQNRDTSKLGAYDHQYSGAGSADLVANWPRAGLTLEPLARGEFILRAAKRRPPWATSDGRQAWEIGLRHTEAGIWEAFEADPAAARGGRPPAPDPEEFRAAVMALVRSSGPLPKGVLEERVRAKITATRGTARAAVALLVADGSLECWPGAGRGGVTTVGLVTQKPRAEGAA